MSQPLDRERPLWEAWLVEGLEGDRWALIFKVHHCMVDGISGVGLLEVLLDLTPDVGLGEAEPWEPEPEPAGTALVLDAWKGALGDTGRWVSRASGALRDPLGAGRRAAELTAGMFTFARRLAFTPAVVDRGDGGSAPGLVPHLGRPRRSQADRKGDRGNRQRRRDGRDHPRLPGSAAAPWR
ncbi:MAG: hypothetical protein M5U19_21705 [Microthrixaceae bacterium]|nr:hypothetical protein [Microthrixaceae bacterium]